MKRKKVSAAEKILAVLAAAFRLLTALSVISFVPLYLNLTGIFHAACEHLMSVNPVLVPIFVFALLYFMLLMAYKLPIIPPLEKWEIRALKEVKKDFEKLVVK